MTPDPLTRTRPRFTQKEKDALWAMVTNGYGEGDYYETEPEAVQLWAADLVEKFRRWAS